MNRSPILCIEGPSAAGKTTLALEIAHRLDAVIIPEPDASNAPPISESAAFFVDLAARTWLQALREAESATCVVLESDPFKGLWYNWVYAAEGWPGIEEVSGHYRTRIQAGELGLPSLYILLSASDDQLRKRREMDVTRKRRNFEKHLRFIRPQREYFTAAAATGLVEVLEVNTSNREPATTLVISRLTEPFRSPGYAGDFLDAMSRWIATTGRLR